jgi:hypothetical protein
MPHEPKPLSERARRRAVGKIREGLIKRREAYFDLLVSGFQRRADRERPKEEFGGGPAHDRPGLPQRQRDGARSDSFAGVTVTGMFEDEKGCTKEHSSA